MNTEQHKRTKIVCTIGPASQDVGMLRAMIRAGMDVARINFSTAITRRTRAISLISATSPNEEDKVVAILADLPGPKLRLGSLVQDPLELTAGDHVTLTAREALDPEQPFVVPMPQADVLRDLNTGERLLLDDGQLEFNVQPEIGNGDVECDVVIGGQSCIPQGRQHARYTAESVVDHRGGPRACAVRAGERRGLYRACRSCAPPTICANCAGCCAIGTAMRR